MHRRKQQITPEKNAHDPHFEDHTFIRDILELKRKECHRYVPKVDSNRKPSSSIESPPCHCGECEKFKYHLQANRSDNGKAAGIATSESWNAAEAIQYHGTNAFGEISFLPEGEGERKPSKYVRLADDTKPDAVIRLLRDFWKMFDPKKPSLVITVIGGAKNFKLDGKKRVIFNKGLINAAQSTSAWIITSGCNMGVMKAVGEALAEGQTFHWDKTGVKQTLKCIGIAPWGYVENRHKLESREKRYKHAQYFVNNVIRHGKPVSLNPNHTHFLLVDDGFRGHYQGVAEFRAQLEKKISQPENPSQGDSGLGIPVILMVVEGGYDAIEDVKKSLENKIPVVVCEGTGRAADILAYAYRAIVTSREQKGKKKILSSDHEKLLKYKLFIAFGETWKDRGGPENLTKQINKFKEMVIQCCENEKLVTVFDMNKHEEELDVAILSALLKGQGDFQSNIKQLELALTWNRSDVAEEKIFNQDVNFPEDELAKVMTAALKEDKVDFVRLAIQNGVIPKKFLVKDRLKDLYFEGPKASAFRQLLIYCNQPTTKDLVTVADLIRGLIGKAGKGHCEVMKDDESQNDAENMQPGTKEEPVFKHPYKELFLWAIFMNQQKMAKYLWQQGSEPLPSALAASWIFGSLAHKLPSYESDLIKSYEKNKEEFEQLAVKVLEECHSADPEKAGLLLKKKNPMWGGMTCLEMAADAKDRAFLSTVCCQNSLNEMWQRGIQSHWFMVLLALFFPPLIAALKFQPVQDTDDDVTDDAERNEMSSEPISLVIKPIEKSGFRVEGKIEKTNTCCNGLQKIKTFYSAPVTKFSANLVTFTLFLALYSYMLLFDFRTWISITEWAMLAWMLTMFVEEIREMFFASVADTVKEKLKEWWQFSIFNRIDLLIFILALIGFILRWFPDQFQSSKTIYCINCALLFLRILRFYSASSDLGPKLLMMRKMTQELLLFLMVFLVPLVAYGIITQTMMYGEREPYGLIFRDIFYFGYWQLFGQLFIDEVQGFACDGVNGTLSHGAPCPNSSWLVVVFTVLYLLVANVLLMNILIAIFNHVFNEIQSNAIEFWKYGMYFLVVEFETKPRLAPPFIILEHIYMIVKFILKASCCHTKSVESESSKIDEVLVAMERECRKQYLQKQKNSENENSQKKIRFIESRVDDVAKMLEEERILEEQRHFDLEGPLTPRRRSPSHSFHEPDLTTLLSQHITHYSAEDEILPTIPSQTKIPCVGIDIVKSKDQSEDTRPLLSDEIHDTTQWRTSHPQLVVEMASDDEDQKEIQVIQKRCKRKTKSHGKSSCDPVNMQYNVDESSLAEARKQTSMSWEKLILEDSDDDVARHPLAQPVEAFIASATGNANNFAGMSQSLQGIENRISGLECHLSDVVSRLVKIEEKAERSLYNIESLLRNAVFYQGMKKPVGHYNQGFST